MSLIQRLPDEVILQVFHEVVSLDWLDRIQTLLKGGFLPMAAGCENDSSCLYPLLFVCQSWLPLARRVLYQGTIHLDIGSPKLASIARSILENDDLCQEMQAFVVNWNFRESTHGAKASLRWSLLLNILKDLKSLRHLVLCPVPDWYRKQIQKVLSQLSCQSFSLVVRDGSYVNIIAHQRHQSDIQATGTLKLPSFNTGVHVRLESVGEGHEEVNTSMAPSSTPFGNRYHFAVDVPSQCTRLVLRNIRFEIEDLTLLLVELSQTLKVFSYHEDGSRYGECFTPEEASHLLPMLEQVEELHYVPFTDVENDNEFVPSRLDINQYWPHLRRFVTSDAFVPFRALIQFMSPHIESVEYHVSDTEKSSSVRALQPLIPQLKMGSPARIYLYKAHLGVYINDGFGAAERRATADWTSGKVYRAKQSCAERNIQLRYWKHDPLMETIGIPDTYNEENMPQGSLAGVSI